MEPTVQLHRCVYLRTLPQIPPLGSLFLSLLLPIVLELGDSVLFALWFRDCSKIREGLGDQSQQLP